MRFMIVVLVGGALYFFAALVEDRLLPHSPVLTGLTAACSLAFAALLVLPWTAASQHAASDRRLARIEAKLDTLLRKAGVTYDPVAGLPPEIGAEITAALRDGRKIEAIKRYRKATGVDLKAAKDFVEGL